MPSAHPHSDFDPTTQQFDAARARDVLPPGTHLGGFRIVELLGRGRFGIVYLALDASLQRQVAIKEYLPADLAERGEDLHLSLKQDADAASHAQGMSAFLKNAKLLAGLDHPSLPRVHGFWEENRTAYMTMAYCEGQSLAAALDGMQCPPDEAWLRALLTPLLGALRVLHASQSYHCGVSTDNIWVKTDGSPVLLGLGAASRAADDKAQPQGPWTDLHALARVLHSAISCEAAMRVAGDAIDGQPSSLVDAARAMQRQFPGLHYSPAFLAGIDRMLSIKPRHRLRSVAEFELWLDGAPDSPQMGSIGALSTAGPSQNAPDAAMPSAAPGARNAWASRRGPIWIGALGSAVLGAAGWWWVQTHPALPPIAESRADVSAAPRPPSVAPMPADTSASSSMEVLPVSLPAPEASAADVDLASSQAEPGKSATEALPTQPDNPRAACGPRTNFSLYHCMQTQCKRPQFLRHRQCLDLRQRDEVK